MTLKFFYKKIICLLSAAVIIFTSAAAAFASDKCGCSHTPVIFVAGFGATTLVEVKPDGSEETAFPFTPGSAVKSLVRNFAKYGTDDILLPIANTVAELVEPIRMNPDGTSRYNLKPVYSSVEDTSYEGFIKSDALKYIPYSGSEFLDMKRTAAKVGNDHVFNFLYDWRLSGDEIADELLGYIEGVIAATGHEKVSIYCLSQGSVPVAQYVYKYAAKGYIENLVFNNPIFDGSDFVTKIFNTDEEYTLTFNELIKLVENILHTEIDVSALGNLVPESVNGIATMGAEQVILPIAKCGPAYLEMIPSNDYDMLCEKYFNLPENAPLLDTVGKVRNGYMKDIPAMLRSAESNGADVSIVSCSGNELVNTHGINSDAIVDLESSCGAYCTPMGEVFPDGYTQEKDIGKNCISPDNCIDLSCGYMPEKTWIINGLFHGQVEWAPNSLELIETLLYTHNIKDAWSDARFPQFMQSNDPSNDLHIRFESTNCLYAIHGGNGRMILSNTSRKNSMLIKSVEDGDSETPVNRILAPGESTIITADTSSCGYRKFSINYCESDTMLNGKTKTFGYTVTDNYSGVLTSSESSLIEPDQIQVLTASVWSFTNDLFELLIKIVKNIFTYIK